MWLLRKDAGRGGCERRSRGCGEMVLGGGLLGVRKRMRLGLLWSGPRGGCQRRGEGQREGGQIQTMKVFSVREISMIWRR